MISVEFRGRRLLNDMLLAEAYLKVNGTDAGQDVKGNQSIFLQNLYIACRANADEADGKKAKSRREYASELTLQSVGDPDFRKAMDELLGDEPKNA